MKAELRLDRNMRIIGSSNSGHEVVFDTVPEVGGENTAPPPMQVMLLSLGACTFMDVVSILRKKRKTISKMNIHIEAERAKEHPKVFTKVHLVYELTSPDAQIEDLQRSIELSQTKYCSASAMFKSAGCDITWEAVINRA
ncbi:MAG: OsmC family protein [Candidatus Kapaibacteriales bacterium]